MGHEIQRLFSDTTRQEFRRYFQPSRIVLGVLPAANRSGVNVITLCFNMHCSYKPPMMAFAVQRGSYSFELLKQAKSCVLAVPGNGLALATLFCGINSGRDVDKVRECKLRLCESKRVNVPGIEQAIANIEMNFVNKIRTGDHLSVFGEVLRFGVAKSNGEAALVSVGPVHPGFRVLAGHGIHRIAVATEGL